VDERPVTRYAKAPDGVSIAYQVFGEGPMDLVMAGYGARPSTWCGMSPDSSAAPSASVASLA
jgi:hypothetical protein